MRWAACRIAALCVLLDEGAVAPIPLGSNRMSASTLPISAPPGSASPSARTALALCLAAVALAFWPTWTSFIAAWLDQREQGFLVAGFCLWYGWRHRDRLWQPGEGVGVASIPLALLSLLWLVGIVLSARLVHQAALPPLLLGWVLAVAGLPTALAALPLAAMFFVVVPFWGVLGPPLQSLTVMANAVLLGFTDINAKIEGTYITIPSGVFEVAAGCSGTKYLESGVTIAAVYSLLFLRTWRARTIAIALAAALSMVSNWLRVVGLIIVGHRTEMQSPLIADHDMYGWVIFAVTLSVFFVVVRRIEVYDDRVSGHETTSPNNRPPAATIGFAQQLRRAVLPTAAALLGPVLLLAASTRTISTTAPTALDGITPSATWVRDGSPVITSNPVPTPSDSAAAVREFVPRYFGADEHRREHWRDSSTTIQLDRMLYFTQAQGKELINAMNDITPSGDVLGGGLVGPLGERNRMINASVARVGEDVHLIWSWFRVANIDTHSRTEAKLLELVEFVSPSHAAELVTVSTRCAPSDCNAATAALFRFVTGGEMPGLAPKP
jgi:exosortase